MQDGLEPHAHLKGHVDLSSAQVSLANLSTATSNREHIAASLVATQAARYPRGREACKTYQTIDVGPQFLRPQLVGRS